MVEKLSKALEGLKNIQFTSSSEDTNISKKEKMFFCVLAADVVVSLKSNSTQNLPVIIENMINLCDDKDSDVRMVADESLNRIIMSLSQANMLKVQVELHNIIKKNGPARCVRAALSRLGQLSCYLRPTKGKGYVQILVPALIEITKREEESIHETLASSLENIFKVLGVFLKDNALKGLLKAFLHNLSSGNPVIRRCSASSIISVVQYCRKPLIFNCFVLNSLLDCVIPVCEENSTDLILGVLVCLRLLLPTLISTRNEECISGSFGLRRKQEESVLSVDRLIQAYELCLHYTNSKDHNVVAAALEALSQILQNPPHQLESFFLSPAGFSRSYIHSVKENRLWSRSGSEMSVAFSLPATDEALLLDDSDIASHLSTLSAGEPFQGKQDSAQPTDGGGHSKDDLKAREGSPEEKCFGEIGAGRAVDVDSDSESVATTESNLPENFLMRIHTVEKEVEGEDGESNCSGSSSPEDLHSPAEAAQEAKDVGSFTDAAVPLIFCARHLAASFLLGGTPHSLKNDRMIRVSVKSLALSCFSAIVRLFPVTMKMSLTKTQTEPFTQELSDVLLFSDHGDPQIRGNVCALVCSFLNSVLAEPRNFDTGWLRSEVSKVNSKNLIQIILKSLQDRSSVCTRQALSAFKLCIQKALYSAFNDEFLPVLEYLPALANNSYWLVKVKLAEVLSELPYVCIYDLTQSNVYQEEVIDSVLFRLLGDEDARVRGAAARALVRIVPALHRGESAVLECGKESIGHLDRWLKGRMESVVCHLPRLPPSEVVATPDECELDEMLEDTLSVVIAKLTWCLLVPRSKHLLFGYLEALKLLSEKYPTTLYSRGWNCRRPALEGDAPHLTSNLMTSVLSCMLTSPFGLDLAAFSHATFLLGNLFAGHAIFHLKANQQVSPTPEVEKPVKFWDAFDSERVSLMAEEILTHLLKVLNYYSRLVEEVTLSSMAESSTVATTFLPLLSPTKKQEKKSDEKQDDRKSKTPNNCKLPTPYGKLQQLLKNAYTNYKVSLDVSVGEKFLDLLRSTLHSLSILLEVATVQETGRCAEEILSYLSSVVALLPSSAVICVNQLLKSLFGTNLAANWGGGKFPPAPGNPPGKGTLFEIFFHCPTERLSDRIRGRVGSSSLECELLGGPRRRSEGKVAIRNFDKTWLATYIRLIEPMIIKSLQLYTITGNVELQSNVLRLLNQFVQLGINYCVLDEKQVFLDFVLKQFELIEHGQIPGVETLLPHIFKFFVLLSYEKQHSKPVMSVPKILRLCDGLMASDQSVKTHCIPALGPVVEDVFLSRTLASVPEEKELETQREVLLSMLLRVAEFPEVMDMLSSILGWSRAGEEKERWKRWSRQVMDALVPLLSQDRLRVEALEGHNSFGRLMASLSPNVLRPIDPVLEVLFSEPADHNCPTSLRRWLTKVTVLLEAVLFVKEDALLNRLEETSPMVNLATFFFSGNLALTDPFNVTSFFRRYEPSETTARFLLKVVSVVAFKIDESPSSTLHLQQKLSMFFVCTYHILKSGTFHRIKNSLQDLLAKEPDSVGRICSAFHRLRHVAPLLTSQFSYFLSLLSYCHEDYWSGIVGKSRTLSGKLVQSAGVISLSDYLCDNLSDTGTLRFLLDNAVEEVVFLSREIPVKELLLGMKRRKSEWAFFLEAVSRRDLAGAPPHFVEKLLRVLELTETSHSGALLRLLVERFLESPRLALSLLAGSIARRQVEYLLTLPREKALAQIDARTLKGLLDSFGKARCFRRHSTLWGLLEKLNTRVLDSSDSLFPPPDGVEPREVKSVPLGVDWFFGQVMRRCCQGGDGGDEIPLLLSKLSSDRILEIMNRPEFNLKLLRNCLSHPSRMRRRHQMQGSERTREEESLERLSTASEGFLRRKVREEAAAGGAPESEERFWDVADCLAVFLEEGEGAVEGAADLAVSCLEVLERNIREGRMSWRRLETGLKCCSAVLGRRGGVGGLELSGDLVGGFIGRCFFIVTHLVPPCRLASILESKDPGRMGSAEQLEFLLDFVTSEKSSGALPDYLLDCVRSLVVSLSRVPLLNSDVLKVPEGTDPQDIDLMKSFISRFSIVGWSSKQQFEEIWVALLSVLGFNTQGDVPQEENGFIVQASAVAVEGITTLLKNTLLDSGGKKLIHHGRDSFSMKTISEKLPLIGTAYRKDDFGERAFQFLDNLEVSQRDDRYFHGLLSLEYLWAAVRPTSGQVELYDTHCAELNAVGLDLPSCIHLLTELYNQWISQAFPDIKIVSCSLKSSVVISDLFTDVGQFQWLLNFCLRLDEILVPEDTVLLPLVVLGCCKAAAVVCPDEEICEKIKKLMLRSRSFPCRISAVEGLLYLLQRHAVVCSAKSPARPALPGSARQGDEANLVDAFLPVALDLIQEFRLQGEPVTEESERIHWSLIFYLLQHYQSHLGDAKEEFFNLILSTLSCRNSSGSVMTLLIRGTQRLLLTTVPDENFRDQLSKVCLEITSSGSPAIARNGLQLLSVLSFIDKRVKDIRQLVTGQEDPEKVMRDMEKINVLFEKLKRSYAKEAEVVGEVIAYVLMDFTASDVLTKVIQEFLSSHQPHQKILAGLLFKVFQRADQDLLEDWVVFSLPSFIQGLPIAMSIWTLNFFFVSASSEPWLRSLFPLVQSRIRMAEAQDKKLLCLSAYHFYKQLKRDSQRISFVETFQKATEIDSVFFHLLSAIS